MQSNYTRHALACALAFGLSSAHADIAPQSAPTPDVIAQILDNEADLRRHRAAFPAYFAKAYAQYPQLPKGSLEAIAMSASRWVHVVPDPTRDSHAHQPPAFGVMGLRDGNGGFADVLAQAAQASGMDPRRIIHSAEANILATAALLSHWISERGGKAGRIEDLAPELKRLSAIDLSKRSAISAFAAEAYVFDVLLAADRGADDHGISLPETAVEWERVFDVDALKRQRAPFVRLDLDGDRVQVASGIFDPTSSTLKGAGGEKSTDYAPALWVASPYNSARSAAASAVTIHTMQGSYAGSISWFQNNPYSVSAHYMVRSSDGQVTQMVRESRAAHHVGSHNGYTLGIEHEGYVSNASWYTTAMYTASAALTRHFCARYAIPCTAAFRGPATSGLNLLSTSIKVKGHQHYSNQTHTDPGQYWDWSRYYNLLNPAQSVTRVLDGFETSEGHFDTSPTYSGSTTGIGTASTAERVSSMKKNGSWSEQLMLVDNAASSATWAVRFLSGGGSPAGNTALTRTNGHVGFWVYTGGTGLTAALGIDDSDGTERSVAKSIPANTWTYLEWRLDDAAQWDAWVNGNGAITASSVTLDAIWFYRAQTSYTVYIYVDDVMHRTQ
jgi:N-acetyl-anhydromuramyl-L-alanine amidase AmpD